MAESPVQECIVTFSANGQQNELTWVVRLGKIEVTNLDNFSLTISIVSSIDPHTERS